MLTSSYCWASPFFLRCDVVEVPSFLPVIEIFLTHAGRFLFIVIEALFSHSVSHPMNPIYNPFWKSFSFIPNFKTLSTVK